MDKVWLVVDRRRPCRRRDPPLEEPDCEDGQDAFHLDRQPWVRLVRSRMAEALVVTINAVPRCSVRQLRMLRGHACTDEQRWAAEADVARI